LKGGFKLTALKTATAVINLADELENKLTLFYTEASKIHSEHKDMFLTFCKENAKYVKNIKRTYYGAITDAIEGGFAFDLNPDNYFFEVVLQGDEDFDAIKKEAYKIETLIIQFYEKAAAQSKYTMSDMARVFLRTSRDKKERLDKIQLL
jgi:hypothetical protein